MANLNYGKKKNLKNQVVEYDTKIKSSSLSSQSDFQQVISRKLGTSTYNFELQELKKVNPG